MKKLLLGIIIILSIFMLFSCNVENIDNTDSLPMDLEKITTKNSEAEAVSANDNKPEAKIENQAEEAKENDADALANEAQEVDVDMDANTSEFVLKAIVKKVTGEHIEVEVIESDYAFGVYWILTSSQTKYYNENSSLVARSNIKVGDTVEISYSGQTMLSYPPQIVAYTICLIK
ncbi:MAG: hypothetical protein J6A95_00470 [Clostridia bacterium]|nr:hypothetical protein [Clostridia bacterium]